MKTVITMLVVVALAAMIAPAYAENHVFTGDNMPQMLDVYQSDTLHFTGTDAVHGIKLLERDRAGTSGFSCTGQYASCPVEFSGFELGQHEWYDPETNFHGKFWVKASQVQTTVVETTVVETPTPVVTSTPVVINEDIESVEEQTKNFKAEFEAKLAAKITPLEQKITQLENENSLLKSQVTDTTELEKYKQEAANWKAIAFEQLRVMAEILGLL
jgi:hypothetical protein